MKNKMYIVKYSTGSYDDYYKEDIFITDKISKAIEYVNKFNKIADRWRKYYRDKYDLHSYRCLQFAELNECWFEEIELR